MFLSEWHEFPSAPCLAGKKTWWQLASRCCWNRAHPWHGSELLSLLVGLRTYQQPGTWKLFAWWLYVQYGPSCWCFLDTHKFSFFPVSPHPPAPMLWENYRISYFVPECTWNVMAHGDAREGKWRGNWRIEWIASTLHTTSEHGVSSITTADAHTSAASSRLNWRPPSPAYLNAVGSQYSSHYLGTWCIQHYYRWCAHLGCQQSTELTPRPI